MKHQPDVSRVLVAGAGRNTGAATPRDFAEAEAGVALADIHQALAATADAFGRDAIPRKIDVRDGMSIRDAILFD